jgi:hypothetical protein
MYHIMEVQAKAQIQVLICAPGISSMSFLSHLSAL